LSTTDIATILSDRLENPRITSWEQVTGVPLVFPVIDHVWDLVDQVGLSDVSTQLATIADQLRQQGTGGLADHIADHNNPHVVTKDQVGLGSVANLPLSDQPTAEAGVSNDVYMTALSTMWAMQKNIITPFNTHAAARNPHGTTASDVGTYSQSQIDNLLAGYLSSSGVAYDSQRLQGMTYATLRDTILQGTAANSVLFNGYSFTDYAAYVLQGTATNSQQFNSMTMPQFLSTLDTRYGGAINAGVSKLFSYSGGGTGTNDMWMLLGTADLANAATAYVPLSDLQWIIGGLTTADNNNSAAYYLRVALRMAHDVASAPTFAVITSMDSVLARDSIGWTVSSDGLTLSIYAKTKDGSNYITVNELSKSVATLGSGDSSLSVEPTGITYVTPQQYVTSTDFISAMSSLKTAFDNLTLAMT